MTAAAEEEADEGSDEEDGFEEVEDVEDNVVEEGEAEGDALPSPGVGEAELPRPAVVLVQPLEPSTLCRHGQSLLAMNVNVSVKQNRDRGRYWKEGRDGLKFAVGRGWER